MTKLFTQTKERKTCDRRLRLSIKRSIEPDMCLKYLKKYVIPVEDRED